MKKTVWHWKMSVRCLGNKSKDFVTAVDEKNLIVVKELSETDGLKELEKMAQNMLELLKR